MTGNFDDAYRILNKDKVLKKVILKTGQLKPLPTKDLYHSLLTCVVSQQLSIKAADTIWNRVLQLFPDQDPTPELVLAMEADKFRACGMSYQKAGYLKNIASFALTETLSYKKLYRKDDETLKEHLIKIKGIGQWSAEMILIFNLNRQDIFPLDDVGIQSMMKSLYGIESNKQQLKQEMLEVANQWKPYRSLACRHLWKYKDDK
jgi:DNA-3-methyladenine glycosylase II